MKNALLVFVIMWLTACNNGVKIDTGTDSLSIKADKFGQKLADSINSKSGRLLDSGKVTGQQAIDTLREKIKKLNKRVHPLRISIQPKK